MAEYFAAQRGLAQREIVVKIIERDQKLYEKDFGTLLSSLSYGIETLGIRSPTRLSSNSFWDEYLKTKRQIKADEQRKAMRGLPEDAFLSNDPSKAGAKSKVTGLDDSDSSNDDSDDEASDSDSDSDDGKRRNKKKVIPASAPAGGRKGAQNGKKPSTAATAVGYSLDDPEFDDENRRRLRNNAMAVILPDHPDSAAKSHPFIKKLLLAKMEPPTSIEDANTRAMAKKKEEEKKKEAREEAKNNPRPRSASITLQQQQQLQLQQQQQQQNRPQTAANKRRSRASLAVEEHNKQQQDKKNGLINPIFLEEKAGQELYRILVQQEIKWTRQAVSEASRRNRLSAKREYSFFS